MDNIQIVKTLASTHPDFARFQVAHSSLVSQASIPAEILEKTLSLLEDDPEQAKVIVAIRNSSVIPKSFMTGGEVTALMAVAFLMRTHIKLERKTDEDGNAQWQFLLEHQPGDGKLITELFKKLESWFNGTP